MNAGVNFGAWSILRRLRSVMIGRRWILKSCLSLTMAFAELSSEVLSLEFFPPEGCKGPGFLLYFRTSVHVSATVSASSECPPNQGVCNELSRQLFGGCLFLLACLPLNACQHSARLHQYPRTKGASKTGPDDHLRADSTHVRGALFPPAADYLTA